MALTGKGEQTLQEQLGLRTSVRPVPTAWQAIRGKGSILSKGKSDSVGKRETLQAWVAALVTVVLWASAFVGIRLRERT